MNDEKMYVELKYLYQNMKNPMNEEGNEYEKLGNKR